MEVVNMLTTQMPLGEYLRKVVEAGVAAKKGKDCDVAIQSASVTKIEATVVTPDGEHQIVFTAKPEPSGLYWSAEASPPLL